MQIAAKANGCHENEIVKGKAYWLKRLPSGAETRADALLGFTQSDENKILFSEMIGVFYKPRYLKKIS